jgi:cob(I)alamin adenosyltransferase
MRSISTTRGDGGETGLAGDIRTSKASLRVDACGNVDELNSTLGFARSICDDAEIVEIVASVQRDLFQVGSSLATPPQASKPQVVVESELVDRLTAHVHRFEAIDGVLGDWSLPGALPVSAAFDVARTVCRRAERGVVRLVEAGEPVQPAIVPYLNRLSDLLWIVGRKLEHDAGVTGSLRATTGKAGNRFSRAW